MIKEESKLSISKDRPVYGTNSRIFYVVVLTQRKKMQEKKESKQEPILLKTYPVIDDISRMYTFLNIMKIELWWEK